MLQVKGNFVFYLQLSLITITCINDWVFFWLKILFCMGIIKCHIYKYIMTLASFLLSMVKPSDYYVCAYIYIYIYIYIYTVGSA